MPNSDKVNGSPIIPYSKAEEPWIEFVDGKALEGWGPEEEIAYNQMHRQIEKTRLFIRSFVFTTENEVDGDYFEFGCHRARTFRMALTEARRHNLDTMKFLAFDSFQGLPAPQTGPTISYWTEGALATSTEDFRSMIDEHGIYTDNVELFKGYYDDSLTPELQKRLLDEGRKIAVTNIDCDLYESAKPVFDFIEPFLQEGSVIYLDDYFCGYKGSPVKGVARAFTEFQETSRFKFIQHLQVGWGGRSFIAYLDDEDVS